MSDLHDEITAWRSHMRSPDCWFVYKKTNDHSQVSMPYVGEFIGE